MNIILLSGGSGKRLWPLSNEVHSKQFIKILKDGDGNTESMVQRVYRQIKNVDSLASITFATSENQVPQLKNQLGDDIDISIEPCRRDTFPAIVLASLYLRDIKKVSVNETVIVSPIDPYVDDEYFKILKVLDSEIKSSNEALGLIGIKPTYPSEKYGYIIPKDKNMLSEVDTFKEKPSLELAKQYIKDGALWNGGVFCFKIGYLIDKAHECLDFSNYYDLYDKYAEQQKISFDYAFVEKEKNIKVVRYDGEWKDIGTWNTLSEVMPSSVIGNVIIDDKSTNTNVVNTLNIPIIVMGTKNAVVAASNDGIFVSDKNESSYNKPLVDKLDNRPMFEQRGWGEFKVLDMYKNSLVKHLNIKAGKNISYQKHNYRDEIWTIVSGEGIFVLDDVEKNVKEGEVLIIKRGQKHMLKAITDLHFIEVQIGTELVEDDIERFDCKW